MRLPHLDVIKKTSSNVFAPIARFEVYKPSVSLEVHGMILHARLPNVPLAELCLIDDHLYAGD